jgi:methyltransferase-like protein
LVEHALQLVLRGYLHLHSYVPHCVSAVSEKPVAFPIARLQAAQPGTRMVTTMMGGMINTDEASNTVLQSLDGSKTHGQLVEIVIDNIKNGRLNAMRDGQPVADLATIRSDVARMVDSVLQKLAQQCLLIG